MPARKSRPIDDFRPNPLKAVADTRPLAFDLVQVDHGLNFPSFDPNAHFANDLFADSSPLPRTSKADADAACASIEEKRQTLRVAQSNIALNDDIVKTGTLHQKLIGSVIDYGAAKVNNHSKLIGYHAAIVNRTIAQTKYEQTAERLTQERHVLSGLQTLTPLIVEEWEQKRQLKQSKIADLKQAVFAASAQLNQEIRTIAANVS